MGELQNLVNDDSGTGLVAGSMEERLVQLDTANVIILQNIEGRLSGTEIIDPYLVSSLLQSLDGVKQDETVTEGCLCDFKLNTVSRYTIALQNLVNLRRHITDNKICL